jgi:bacillithiol system protein YtxJ
MGLLRLKNLKKFPFNLNWCKLESESDLEQIINESFQQNKGVVIFKHSTRCSISTVAKSRLESSWDFDAEQLPIYYLDIISFRSISARIAEEFNIQHESPQILIVKNGDCIYNESHMAISVKNIHTELKV